MAEIPKQLGRLGQLETITEIASTVVHGFFLKVVLRKPHYEFVLVTDFSYARPDERSPNECLLEFRKICIKNHVNYRQPILQDHAIYSLNPVNGAFNIDLYARALEHTPTIFVGVVDPGVGGAREGVVIITKNDHVYIGPNNGIFWEAISREGIKETYKVKDEVFKSIRSATFHGRDVFVPIAAEITSGKKPSQLTGYLESLKQESLIPLNFQPNQILVVDGFNLIKINGYVPPNAEFAKVTVRDRVNQKLSKIFMIPTALKFVDRPGDIMIYPGSCRNLMEIAVSNKVFAHEDNAVKQLTLDPKNPIAPGDILDIEWVYENMEN